MPEEEKPSNFATRLKDVFEDVNRLAGLVLAAVSAITFSTGNHLESYVFILIAAALLDWLLWTSLTGATGKEGELIIATQSREAIETINRANARRRPLAIASIAVITFGALGWIALNGYQDYEQYQTDSLIGQGYFAPTATPSENLILLADFDWRGGNSKYDADGRILERLQEELKKAKISNTRIVQTPQVSTEEEALKLGQRHQAVFVIWGWYDDIGIRPKFTVIKSGQQPLAKTEVQEVLADPSRDFELYISQGLPAEMSHFAVVTLGQLYYTNGQYDEAVGAFDEAIAYACESTPPGVAPAYPACGSDRMYLYRGNVYARQGKFDQAIADYNKAIELDPKYALPYYNRGIAYKQQGLNSRAVADFVTYLQLNPNAADRAQVEQFISQLR